MTPPDTPSDLITFEEAERVSERSKSTIRRWVKDGKLTRYEGTPPASGGSPPALFSRSELLGFLVESGQLPRQSAAGLRAPAREPDDTLRRLSDDTPCATSALDDTPSETLGSASGDGVSPSREKPQPPELVGQLLAERDQALAEIQDLRLQITRLEADRTAAELRVELAGAQAAVEVARLAGEAAGLRVEVEAARQRIADAIQQLEVARSDARDWRDRHDALAAELRAVRRMVGVPWWRRMLGGSVEPPE